MLVLAEPQAPMVPRVFRVVERVEETADTVTLSFEPEHGAQIEFRPGQFDMIYAFGVGEVPISFSGMRDGRLLHTVRAVGAVSRAICGSSVGDSLGVRGPFGTSWDLESAHGRDILIVAGGIGLAPLRPAIEQVFAQRELFGRFSVLIGARSPELLLFREEIAAWRSRFDVEVEVTVDVAAAGWRGDVGLVTSLLPRAPFDPAKATAFVCGPEIMMRGVATALMDAGMAADDIRVSMERNMKCAIGHCGHCQLGPEFICKDGPVFPYPRVARWMGVREM